MITLAYIAWSILGGLVAMCLVCVGLACFFVRLAGDLALSISSSMRDLKGQRR